MSLLSAKSTENLHFKFFQLRKLAITDTLDTNVINNLAISHSHQVIFAAYGNAFKAIRIATLLDYEWDKKVLDTIVNSYPALEIKLPYKPSLLSVSGGLNNTLLIFGQNEANNLSGDIFDIPTLLAGNPNPVSRLEFPPTISQNVYIQSVAWHPEFSETLFASTTSNGALVTIGIDQQTKGVQLLAHYTDSFKFTCVSWSPKGKQIVVGGDNGQLTQFKHSNGKGFQKAKMIPAPSELATHKIINVNWVHSALFQVAYVHKSPTNSPDTRVIFIHAPAKQTPEYHDYGYVCMETNQLEGPDKIRITFSEIGNILLCLSSLSNEVSVIGCETPEINPSPLTWQQWMLDDASRIELSGADGSDAYPVGVTWFNGPTKVFKINESVSFGGQGWPLIVVLTSAGLLCPYYACHLQGKFNIPDFPPSQPLPISVPVTRSNRPDIQTTGQQPQQQQTTQAQGLSKSPTQTFPAQQSQPVDASFTFSLPKTGQEKPKPQTSVSVAATVQTPVQQQQQQISQQFPQQSQQQSLLQQQAAQQQNQKNQQIQQQNRSAPQQQQQVPSKPVVSEEELRQKELEVMEETFSIAINEEILEFTNTLQNAKINFSKALNLHIGKPDELVTLQSETASLSELLKLSSETIKSLDLSMLNGYLLETWSMVQDATTRLENESNPVYTMLANRRSIDPITARKMREIKKMTHEIEMYLDDLNNMLDREWEEYVAQLNSKKLPTGLSSIDMVYHTLSTHHKTIEMLKKSLSKYDVYLESIELEESGVVSPRRKEIQDIINCLKNTSIREDNSISSEISHSKSMIKVPNITKEKKEKLLEFFEQRNSVPIRRAILPVDLKSSKMVSAVVKAKERLKEIRVKSESPVRSWENLTSSQSKSSDLNSTLQPNQVTPVKLSERTDPDKSLFYSTAIGDISLGDTSRYQSPVKSLNFLSPITTKTDQRLQSKSQPVSDKSIFKEPEPSDKSTPFVAKTESKDESFSCSFSTTMGNIASPSPSSSTFLFGPSSIKPADKGFASTFATATKDISIISKDKDTPTTTIKENIQPKSEPKESKTTTSVSSASTTIIPVTTTVASSKSATAFPAFTFPSATSTATATPVFSFKPTLTTTITSQSTSTVPVSSAASTITSVSSPAIPVSKSNVSNAPFSFSAATSGFTFSNTVNASSLFASPNPSQTHSTNDSKTSTSLFSTEKPSNTTGFSFGDGAPSTTPSFSFGGSLAPTTASSTATSIATVTSTTVTPATITTTTGTASTTTTSTITNSASSITTTITPVSVQPFSFGTTAGQVASLAPVSTVTSPSATPLVFYSYGIKTKSPVAISTTSSSTTVSESVASTATTVTPVFTSVTSSSATPLNLTSGSSIFSTSTTPSSSSTTTSVAPTNTGFGLGATTISSNAEPQVSTTTPTSPSLFGGPPNTTAFFTPTSFSLSSSQADVVSSKANEPTPAFNFNTALANLGGQPNLNSTPSNPFGSSIVSPSPQLNLFSPKTTAQSSTFGSPSSMSTSFASQGPGVAQTGFGSFSTQNQPRFGAQPTFGGAPAFGNQPTFGGSPTFGSTLPFGKTASSASLGFGQPAAVPTAPAPQSVVQPTATASPFGGFASANTPSFGALASQQAPTFGQLAASNPQPPVQQQQPSSGSIFGGFGQPAISTSPSIFGNTFPSAPTFGSPQFSQRRQ